MYDHLQVGVLETFLVSIHYIQIRVLTNAVLTVNNTNMMKSTVNKHLRTCLIASLSLPYIMTPCPQAKVKYNGSNMST